MIRVYTRRPPGFYLTTDVQSITFISNRINDLTTLIYSEVLQL